ncbi:hypothetical protein EWM64_g2934 [Hericium alpestre]|uniref:Uncharacterized protein n=1 Tax=Hericium alpestre TaxID=135208 RepID=A0A4Z0A4B0_9AGAM|nr:hypothetical protein EWM64_g2934 [Hericium alpestre]
MSSSSGTQSPDSSLPLEENDDDRLHFQDQLLYGAFVASRSRVVRFSEIPTPASAFLYDVFFGGGREERTPLPVPFSVLKDTEGGIWAIYGAHEEADAALALSRPTLIVLPALESDLQPISKFHRLDLAPLLDTFSSRAQLLAAPQSFRRAPLPTRGLRLSVSSSDLRSTRSASRPTQLFDAGYTMSSNPPNPKSMFRAGDWILRKQFSSFNSLYTLLSNLDRFFRRSYADLTPTDAPSRIAQNTTLAQPPPFAPIYDDVRDVGLVAGRLAQILYLIS